LGLLSFKMDERPPYPGIDTMAKIINKSHPTLLVSEEFFKRPS
jgi:hypothetical protein